MNASPNCTSTSTETTARYNLTRTPEALRIEALRHELTLWFVAHNYASMTQFKAQWAELEDQHNDDVPSAAHIRFLEAWYALLIGDPRNIT